jgi:hypothetical protein
MNIRVYFAVLSLLLMSQTVFAEKLTLRYHIYVNNYQKGLMSLTVENNKFQSEYFNVDLNDRIPFYYPKKSGKYDLNLYSSELTFGDIVYDIFKEAQKVPAHLTIPEMYKRAGKSIMISRKEGLATLVFDKIPMVCLENILIGLYEKKIKENDLLYLYEESTKSQFIIFYVKKGRDRIKLNKQNVMAETYLFMRKNIPGQPAKPIFKLNCCNNIPVRITSLSERWVLNLYKMGKEQIEKFDRTDEFMSRARIKIANNHDSHGSFKGHVSHQFSRNRFNFQYKTTKSLTKYSNKDLIKKHLYKNYKDSSPNTQNDFIGSIGFMDVKTDVNSNDHVIYISDRNICTYLKRSGKKIDSSCQFETETKANTINYRTFINTIKGSYKEELVCWNVGQNLPKYVIAKKTVIGENSNFQEINCKQALKHFVKHSSVKISNPIDIKCPSGMSSDCEDIVIYSQVKNKINYESNQIKKYAARILEKQLNYSLNTNRIAQQMDRVKIKGREGYELRIPMQRIRDFEKSLLNRECQHYRSQYTRSVFTITNALADYNTYQCTLSGESYIPQTEVTMENTLFLRDKMLRFFKHHIKTQGQYWIYPTVPDVSNLCR